MTTTGSFNNALPIISLYVFAGYRLMPALQQTYASLTQLTFVGPSLDALTNDIKNLKSLTRKIINLDSQHAKEKLLEKIRNH